MAQFQIFKQNTDAIATNRGFYYQYLKTVKLWLDNYVDGIDNEIYCEREDDIFEQNSSDNTYKFRQIKCFSKNSGLNNDNVKSSLLNFYMLYEKYGYVGEFYFESNIGFTPESGKTLAEWNEKQKNRDFSADDYVEEVKEIFTKHIDDKLEKYLDNKKRTIDEKDESKEIANGFHQKLEEPRFKDFLESIRWNFSEELDTYKVIANLSEDILKIISNDIKYDNRVNKELFLGYLVNTVLEKSIVSDENKRLLTNALLKEALEKTKIDDTLFSSEIKELLKSNFFIPHSLTEPLKREELFIGREDDFVNMREFLSSKNSLLLVHSIGGMGKTTLVKEFLHKEKNNYAHYGYLYAGEDIKQNWVNSGFRKSLSLVMEKTDEAFRESLIVLPELEGKTLLVIDNIEKAENQEEALEKIMGLAQNPNIDILITSREIIEEVHEPYELKALSKEDAKLLFNSIYEIEDEDLLEEVLEYLDWHTFFIEKVAQTLKNKKGLLSLEDIKEKFDRQEFPDIRLKKRNSFNDLLKVLFTLDELADDEVLLLKQLSVLPSIDIEFDFLAQIFQGDDVVEFQEDLEYLNEKGWLIYTERSYKLHQVIKEFILANYMPSFEDIEGIINFFNKFLENSVDIHIAIERRNYIVYLFSLIQILKKIKTINEKIATVFRDTSNIYRNLGMYKESFLLIKEAIKMYTIVFGEEHITTASSYNNFGLLHFTIGNMNEAEKLFKKSLNLTEKITDKKDLYIASIYNNLGEVHKSLGCYDKSEEFFLKALDLDKELLSKNNINRAIIYNNLGEIYRQKVKYDLSHDYYIKALTVNKNIFGIYHPIIATNYNNLGLLYDSMSKHKDAKESYDKAIVINNKIWGESHINVAMTYNNLAIYYQKRELYNEAEKWYLKALFINKKLLGLEYASTIMNIANLAELYRWKKEYKKAEPLYFEALNLYKKLWGEEHLDIATIYNNLALLYFDLNNFKKAYKYIKMAYTLREKYLVKNHPLLLEVKESWKRIERKFKTRVFSLNQKSKRNDPCPCNSGKKYKKCCGKLK